jgi:hypothetical protein
VAFGHLAPMAAADNGDVPKKRRRRRSSSQMILADEEESDMLQSLQCKFCVKIN